MRFITLEQIAAHSRIDDIREGTADTALLELYGESAEYTVMNYLDRTLEEIYETYGRVPAPIVQATLMLVDNSYLHRSPTTVQNIYRVEYSFDALLKPYMSL